MKRRVKFRFEDLEIWKDAIAVADQLYDIADSLDKARLFRFPEQLRGAALSISNNIAEGSGSDSSKAFVNYLKISRRSLFECANILIVLERRGLLETQKRKTF